MAIDLNSLHVLAGGSSGSTATINDADIRGKGGSVRAAGSGKPLDFDWFEESPFVIATFPSIGNWGETSTSTLSNPNCWVQFYHDTGEDRIRVGYKTSNIGTTYTQLSYTVGTGNLLDNLTWQAKANWSMDSETTSAATEPVWQLAISSASKSKR